jgi:hypothetical protein
MFATFTGGTAPAHSVEVYGPAKHLAVVRHERRRRRVQARANVLRRHLAVSLLADNQRIENEDDELRLEAQIHFLESANNSGANW